jgi:hypothetical protein
MNPVLDDKAKRTKPSRIVYTLTKGTIGGDNGDPTAPDRTKVWARAGGKAVFTIQNNDVDAYEVTIPFREFVRKDGGPGDPIDEHATAKATVRVQPAHVDTLTYVIKQQLPFPPTQSLTYKYTLYYTNLRTGKKEALDPDLEVSP